MITESALRRACTAATFAHARRVAEEGSRLHRRRCGQDGSDVSLRASVESGDSWESPHKVFATVDEETGVLEDYGCDCVGSLRKPGPCKHVIALVLDYLLRPERYEGARAQDDATTSRSLARLIERGMATVPATDVVPTEQTTGTVDLALTLTYEVGFGARFRIGGSKGSYALASISDFVTQVEERSFVSYGKNLAFAHEPEAFCERGRAVANVLVRAIRNRRAYSYERVTGRGAFGAPAMPTRELHLSPPELEELLACYVGHEIVLERVLAQGDVASNTLTVTDEDPQVSLSVVVGDGGALELVRPQGLHVVSSGGRAYAWDDRSLYVCGDRMSSHADVLSSVFGDTAQPLVVAPRDARAFCATVLPSLEEVAEVAVPPELDALRPVPCELRFYLDRKGRAVSCAAFALYGDERVSLASTRKAARQAQPDLVRDVVAEAHAREVCRRLFPQVGEDGTMVSRATGESLARLVFDGVRELQRLGTVFTTSAFDSLRCGTRLTVRVGLSVRSHLLDVSFYANGIDASEVAGILESYRLKKRFHRLQDGSFVELANADVSQAGTAAQELGLTTAQIASGSTSVPAYRALPMEPLLDEGDVDESVVAYLDRIRGVDLAAYEVPKELAGVLRPYQADGYRWLCGLADMGLGGILADEMGLGKSVQLISLLLARADEARDVGPSLVVCPASLVFNWLAELQKFAPQLDAHAVTGTAQERAEMLERGADVLVTSYDLLRRDLQTYAEHAFWCVVLDEAQYVKNHETQTAQAVKELRSTHRIALSGTPVENRLSELWSIFDFLMPGLLGSYERFREQYERPIVEGDQEASGRLSRAIGPFVLRRTKRDVVRDLPDKVERTVHVRMGERQRAVYDAQALELRGQLEQGGESDGNAGKLQILAGLTRLRQICCDPQLVFEDYREGSAKTEALLTLLGRLADSGQKTLVFSQFTSYLDTVASRLGDQRISYFQIYGSTPKQRRVELVDRFNGDDTPVFLISLKAGGTGLNLTGASAVVHADPWWNVAAQNQATDRAHRIGQTKSVTVYRLIASDTIEERIVELQQAKTQLADVVAGGAAGMSLASLSREDLEVLLG